MVEQLTAYLDTATQVDGAGIIEQLMFVCTDDRPEQSSMRCLSQAVAAFVANCTQFVPDDDTEIFIESVCTVPLVYGFDLLCKVDMAYGSVAGGADTELANVERNVTDVQAIEHAMEVWRQRAYRAIASGYEMEEGNLVLFLDGLARFGVKAA
ncbi:hypothetical protein AQ910_05690 [Burkholderia pseudomallei]|uniref:hypothetical protein n=1 Tax=Burkholderia pseudomallei TaxID=28450 RepID=UPI0005725808|nr:hypothetical protein [Burkholderia pseudomallei]ONC06096.1 hypothetical protein AQ910_05690 [Burkholderia pseudomallei]